MRVPTETHCCPRTFLLKSDFMDSRFVFVHRPSGYAWICAEIADENSSPIGGRYIRELVKRIVTLVSSLLVKGQRNHCLFMRIRARFQKTRCPFVYRFRLCGKIPIVPLNQFLSRENPCSFICTSTVILPLYSL